MSQVDPESMRSSPLVLPWLRLVQAARNRAEQNTEAFLKAGQLFFRTLRHVQQGEELLVWYDEELTHLLGLSDIRVTPTPDGKSLSECVCVCSHVGTSDSARCSCFLVFVGPDINLSLGHTLTNANPSTLLINVEVCVCVCVCVWV